ncbi:Rieske (2Fe-2S) protein [Sphingobium boeckii]|uniref:3-phenylpropionate/trans-cinnamate dioxygenase ferredoxin subunit n=1 Tax=Sphingobium boeckii TaxID=1082345 RepID=A0A7W9AJS1_9SPHN|nr:non-heme iron oxygenase ferredoxin subunit [Sphingobium boeckii]MBB5686709.1 3-phenylpropionate/trans-cinnamate dioxygenase ferredoxin subunit [Sphingobium boeckii]
MSEQQFIAVAQIGEVEPGKAKRVEAGGRAILLCNSDGQIYAVENLCSHAQEPLECGRIRYGWIACPAHGARFDLETGEPLNPPATDPIAIFPVRIVGETIEIAV